MDVIIRKTMHIESQAVVVNLANETSRAMMLLFMRDSMQRPGDFLWCARHTARKWDAEPQPIDLPGRMR